MTLQEKIQKKAEEYGLIVFGLLTVIASLILFGIACDKD